MKIAGLIGMILILMLSLASASPPATTVDQLLGKYFAIHNSLASDSTNGIAASAVEIVKISRQAAVKDPGNKAPLDALAETAAKFQTTDLKTARDGFGELSDKLIAYLKASGLKTNPPYQFYCSMVKKNWLQPDKAIRNPYYGSSMPKCGELVPSAASVAQPTEHQHH